MPEPASPPPSPARRWLRRAAIAALLISGLGALALGATNAWILRRAEAKIVERASEAPDRRVAIVLGARVWPDGRPSAALRDRLHAALDLYREGKVSVILVSGDNGQSHYNEVSAMYRWLRERDVPRAKIFADHAGFRTLDSMQRAAQIFEVREAIICTQRFHLPRSIFLAESFGIKASGLVADRRVYSGRRYNQLREAIARMVAVLDIHVWARRAHHDGPSIPITESSEPSLDASMKDP